MSDFFFRDALRRCAPRVLLIAACAGAACTAEKSSVVPSGVATGTIDFAVGARVRSFDVLDASCESVARAGETTLHIVVPAAFTLPVDGRSQQPTILSAQLPLEFQRDPGASEPGSVSEITFGREQSRFGASASALNVNFDGEVYAMIQIIAQSARDVPDYECRASRDGAQIELICNDALVFPWRNPGAVPGGSFRAKFQCAPHLVEES